MTWLQKVVEESKKVGLKGCDANSHSTCRLAVNIYIIINEYIYIVIYIVFQARVLCDSGHLCYSRQDKTGFKTMDYLTNAHLCTECIRLATKFLSFLVFSCQPKRWQLSCQPNNL